MSDDSPPRAPQRGRRLPTWADARRALPRPADLPADLLAGLTTAISSVPDSMASGTLAGVSPVRGLYAAFAGPIAGGLSASTKRMVITTTSAASLAAGSALAGMPADQRGDALGFLTMVAGAAMVIAGVVRLGRYTRFVPHSVMMGFLTGVAVNIVLGQIPDLLGYQAKGAFNLAKAVDAILHVQPQVVPPLAVGAAAMALILILQRTPLSAVGALFALVLPTAAVLLLGIHGVAKVSDSGAIPRGFPLPDLPQLRNFRLSLLSGGAAIAAIVLVQGVGVAESAPNQDGSRSRPNRDFWAQGLANLAAGLWTGIPVGGSVGQTALAISSGSRSRWASVFTGLWMLIILVLFAGLVGYVAVPTLAGLLIVAAISSIRTGEVWLVFRTSRISQIGMITTFLATLFLPVAAAVGIGIAIALLLQLNQDALDLTVVELVPAGGGRFTEQPAPRSLPSAAVTVLDVYGSLYYAGSRTLQRRMPDPAGATGAAVVLRLRGRTMIGATFVVVLEDYLGRLADAGGRLFLSGVDPGIAAQIDRFERFTGNDDLVVLQADPMIGASTDEAYQQARRWLSER